MKLRFGLRSCAGLFLAGAGFFLPTPALLALPPILPNINTNNVITITNAPYNAVGDGALLVGIERRLDLNAHRSRQLNREIVDESDLILPMGPHPVQRGQALGGA